jgi:hypothetical protein
MEQSAAILGFFAALYGFFGTNQQARLSRARLLEDEDPLIVEAGKAWMPLWSPGRRKAEAAVRVDRARWARYRSLARELRAWNMLESSVAAALVATMLVIISGWT